MPPSAFVKHAILSQLLGKTGIVNRIHDDGDVFVEFPKDTNRWFNPKLLTVVDTSNIALKAGDIVLVNESYKKVKALQDDDHGGWIEEMRKCLGTAAVVLDVLSNGRARVFTVGRPWTFNVKALHFIGRDECDVTDADSTSSGRHNAEVVLQHLANTWRVYAGVFAYVSLFSLVWFRMK